MIYLNNNRIFNIFCFFLSITFLFGGPNLVKGEYKLIFQDEFNYSGLPDSSKWKYDVGGHGWGNYEKQYYRDANLNNAFVSNGTLKIKAIKENFEGNKFTSAKLISKCGFKYGKFEIRAKAPGGKGVWPAIWMLPTDFRGRVRPDMGEIDIMEHLGYLPDFVYGTVHTKAYNHMIGSQVMGEVRGSDWETSFHVYTFEWTDHDMKWYADGKHYHTYHKHGGYEQWPFDEPFSLILNLAVGGAWGSAGGFDQDIWPKQLEIDYIRVYVDKLNTTVCE